MDDLLKSLIFKASGYDINELRNSALLELTDGLV